MKNILAFCFVVFLTYNSSAAFWLGGGGDMTWSNPANWDTGVLPGPTEPAVFLSGYNTFLNPVIVDIDPSIRSIELVGGYVKVPAGRTLTLTPPNTFSSAAAEIVFNGALIVEGTVNVYGAIRFDINGSLTVNPGGYVAIDGSHPLLDYQMKLFRQSTINNSGTIIGFNNEQPNGNPISVFIEMDRECFVYNYGVIQSWELGQQPVVNGITADQGSQIYNFPTGEIWIDLALNNGISITNSTLDYGGAGMTNEGVISTSQCTTCPGTNPNPAGAGVFIGTDACLNNQPSGTIITHQAGTAWPVFIDGSASTCAYYNGPLSIPVLPPGTPYNPGSFVIGAAGSLVGTGLFNNSAVTIEGTISPGFSPGIITFTDNLNTSSTTFDMELAGLGGAGISDGHDQVILQGATNNISGNTLNIELIDGYTPQVGDSFTLLTGAYTGTFGNVIFPGDANLWTLNYNGSDITLELSMQYLNDGKVGVGTIDPKAGFQVSQGDVYIETVGASVVIKTSNTTCHKIVINPTTGAVTAVEVDCPN